MVEMGGGRWSSSSRKQLLCPTRNICTLLTNALRTPSLNLGPTESCDMVSRTCVLGCQRLGRPEYLLTVLMDQRKQSKVKNWFMTWRGSADAYLTTQVALEARFVVVVDCSVSLPLTRPPKKSTADAAEI